MTNIRLRDGFFVLVPQAKSLNKSPGPDGTEVRADVAKATNVCHLRLEACKSSCLRKSGIVGVMSSDELSFTEVATGKILTDSCDLSSSKDVKLRVSTCLSDMILAGRLRLIYADGRACEADVKHAYHLRQIFDCVAKHTSRPPEFVRIFAGCKTGNGATALYPAMDLWAGRRSRA